LHSRDAALKIRHPLQICHQKQKEQRTGSAGLPGAFLHNSKGTHPLAKHDAAIASNKRLLTKFLRKISSQTICVVK